MLQVRSVDRPVDSHTFYGKVDRDSIQSKFRGVRGVESEWSLRSWLLLQQYETHR